jgi:chemosensory pili system protein ChpA (sensor histidine kinase/response regulator)
MNARIQFDAGPLSWVKGEIDQAMRAGADALREFAAGGATDVAKFHAGVAHLHQANGALAIVGLDGVTRVAEELEGLLADIGKGVVAGEPAVFELCARVITAITGYLEQLMSGAANQPLRLFPIYSELVAARNGGDAQKADQADLYFPDLSPRPPRRERMPVTLHSEEAPRYFRDQRTRYQRGFLKWLKNDANRNDTSGNEGALEMFEAVRAIEQTQGLTSQRSFWWAAQAFFEALVQGALPADLDARRICNRVEAQLRRLVEGSQNVAERLMREVLYGIALARPVTPAIEEVQQTFRLAGTVPGAVDAPAAEPAALAQVREVLAQVKDCWNRLATEPVGPAATGSASGASPAGHAGSVEAVAPTIGDFNALSSRLVAENGRLGHADVARLATDIHDVGVWLSADAARMSEVVALEVATALLLLENVAERFTAPGATPGEDFREQREFVSSRLTAMKDGNLLRTAPGIPLLDEMSRRAQERLITNQVVGEMQSNLRVVEQVLDGFFRDPSHHAELTTLEKPVQQMMGALDMLGESRARDALAMCATGIHRYADPVYAPLPGDFEATAQALSGLGFYFDALINGNADFDASMRPVQSGTTGIGSAQEPVSRFGGVADAAPTPQAPASVSVEAQLEEQKEKAQALFQEWKRRPTDTLLKAELQRELTAIQKDAGLVADTALETQAQSALQALQGVQEAVNETAVPAGQDEAEHVVEQALGGMVKVTEAPAPSAQAVRMLDASPEAVDAELVGIYLEEADEVLAHIAVSFAKLRNDPSDSEALTVVRRSFHTLKGSGRMVGLMRLGDAAWAVEQTLNRWLQHSQDATPDLLALIGAGELYFADNVNSLRNGGGSSDETALVAMAEAVRNGQPLPAVVAPALSAPEPSAPAAPSLETPDSPSAGTLHGIDFGAMSDAAAASQLFAASATTDLPELPGDGPSPAALAAAEADDDTIELGGHRISTTVFTLFSGEAHAHLGTLHTEHETLINHGVVTDDMMRAAHTLAGLAGTVQLDALRELGYAFEHALSQLATDTLSEDELALVAEALEAIDRMVAAAVEMRVPKPTPELIVRLNNAIAPRMVEDLNSDQVLLPEEEAVLPRIDTEAALPGIDTEAALPRMVAETALPASVADAAEKRPEPHETPVERQRARVPDGVDMQMLPIFLDEAADLMPSIDTALRAWRDSAAGDGATGASFATRGQALQRLLHTFKGSARMAGAMALGDITHHMESRVEAALAACAAGPGLFDELDASWDRAGALHEELRDHAADHAVTQPGEGGDDDAVLVRDGDSLQPMLRVHAEMIDRLVSEAGEVAIARSRIENEIRALKASIAELTDNASRLRSQLREIEIQAETQMQAAHRDGGVAAQGSGTADARHKEGFDPLEFDRFTRFQELTRIMAESVNDVQTVQQNMLQGMNAVDTALATQARLSRDLQHDLLRVRMVPLGSLAERLHRIVRVTARELGKRVSLTIHGATVELDRAVLERVTPAFEHLLRNAVMHGIELPALRGALGKPAAGEIRLELTQEGNEVRIQLSDDGGGLDLDRIRAKARDRGLITDDAPLTDAELIDFIFMPGFTTADHVTQIAGRGVGMDVVRTVVAALGGRVEVTSTPGVGMSTMIFLPLTLAVTQSVLAHAGARLFAIPSVMVEHVLQYRPEEMEQTRTAGHVDWQGRRYSLQHLSVLLGEPESLPAMHDASRDQDGTSRESADRRRATIAVLLLKSGASSLALQVQELAGGNQEIVVKATGPHLQRIAGVTGATVLGSGEIVLIINPVQLAEHAARVAAAKPAGAAPQPEEAVVPMVMVVDDSLTVRKITSRLLERHGYDVVVAKDGVDALEKLRDVVPGVMLVDIEMPRMDGFDLTRHVRADARLAKVPIIVISSRTADKHRHYALEIGVNAFLGKPYQEEELLGQIRGFLGIASPPLVSG